jgi:hypothetical protein
MPARPFRVTGPAAPTDIARRPDGTFTRGSPAAPPQVVRRSSDEGRDVTEVIREERAVEHRRPAGTPATTPSENPWAPLGPTFNEARKLPFRVR